MARKPSNNLLSFLQWVGKLVIDSIDDITISPGTIHKFTFNPGNTREWRRFWEDRETRKNIYYLRRKKLMVDKKINDKFLVYFDDKLVVRGLKEYIISKTDKIKDEKILFVIFDIPTGANKTRTVWRNFLKQAGFIQLQQSVWITNKEVTKEIITLSLLTEIDSWLKIFKGEEITRI